MVIMLHQAQMEQAVVEEVVQMERMLVQEAQESWSSATQ